MLDDPMPTSASVLVFGRDHQLVHTRGLILEKAGFHVSTAASLPDIRQLPSEPHIDVMLLCHTLSGDDCDGALAITRDRWPHIQTIAMISGRSDCGSKSTDAAIDASEGPAKLVSAIRNRLH
jgi:DNA-binding response OmpR family regulator